MTNNPSIKANPQLQAPSITQRWRSNTRATLNGSLGSRHLQEAAGNTPPVQANQYAHDRRGVRATAFRKREGYHQMI